MEFSILTDFKLSVLYLQHTQNFLVKEFDLLYKGLEILLFNKWFK